MNDKCVVPIEKVRDYLLNPDHEDGAPKSAFFRAHGFDRANCEPLRQALVQHFVANPPSKTIETLFGRKYVVLGELQTPDGRRPIIQSVWIVSPQDRIPRFVTAVPRVLR